MSKQFPKKYLRAESGLTLVETLVSLLIFLAVLAGVVPLYISYRLQTLKNPVRTGAVAVSQQVMDDIRRIRPLKGNVPDSGSEPKDNLSAYGKSYKAIIYYCEKAQYCDEKSRYVRVAVFQKFTNTNVSSDPAYEVSTIFTEFDAK
ncbi:MAG: type II secretion system protein [Thermosynechococcaceae cyanobacterium]